MRSMADAWAARAGDDNPALRYEGSEWSWRAMVDEAARRAAWWSGERADGPPHIGVLLDNVPEHVFWLGACALAGAAEADDGFAFFERNRHLSVPGVPIAPGVFRRRQRRL